MYIKFSATKKNPTRSVRFIIIYYTITLPHRRAQDFIAGIADILSISLEYIINNIILCAIARKKIKNLILKLY